MGEREQGSRETESFPARVITPFSLREASGLLIECRQWSGGVTERPAAYLLPRNITTHAHSATWSQHIAASPGQRQKRVTYRHGGYGMKGHCLCGAVHFEIKAPIPRL